jgi:predicted small lipoprotein YifL
MSRFWLKFGLVAIVLAGLAGCGQKGPLYLPDEDGDSMMNEPMAPGGAAPGNEAPGNEAPGGEPAVES